MKVLAHIKAFLKDEEGASGIEYALIAGMVAVVIAAVSGDVRTAVTTIFTNVKTALQDAAV